MRGVLAMCAALLAACAPNTVQPKAAAPAATEPPPIVAGQAPGAGEYPRPFDALHYDIHVSLPADGTRITGSTEIRLAAGRGRSDTLALDFTGLAIVEAHVNGMPTTVGYADGKVLVPVPRNLAAGDEFRVRIEYTGTPDDGLIIRNNVHGRRAAFADNWPNRARFWFPAIDHPADKASAAFTIDAPAAWQVIANGQRVEPAPVAGAGRPDSPQADQRRSRWEMTEPISTYNMVVGAANFDVHVVGTTCVEPRRCIEVTTWLFPEDSGKAAAPFRRAVEMVAHFSTLIAPYPYAKLAHVQSSTRFGGMENATAIFYDQESLAKGRDIEAMVAHETAHQWFGNAVTPADWPDLWLSEGFATYFANLFFEHADGVERLRQRMETDRVRVVRSDVSDRPIVDTMETDLFKLLNANSYQKGGWVLHMLRGVVGDRAFFDGMRRYYAGHTHGVATTADFRAAMEQASGRGLDWFFNQWVLQPGFPRFRVTSRWDSAARAAEIVVEQTQRVSWPTFRLPLTLEIRTEAGTTRRVVEVDERREVVRIPGAAPVLAVTLDPDGWVLKEIETKGGT